MILVFGSVCLDLVRRVPELPPKGGYVEVSSDEVHLGGEAANTACHLHSWGFDVELCGNGLGNQAEGKHLRRLVIEAGLEDKHLSDEGRTPVCEIFVTPDGERTMFGLGFSAMDNVVDVTMFPYLPGAWFSAEPNMARASRAAVRKAAQAGMKLYLMDFIRENEEIPVGSIWQSSTDWFGERGNHEINLRLISEWSHHHQCTSILTDGAKGLYLSQNGQSQWIKPNSRVDVVDSTGAGDAFRAGTLAGLERGYELLAAIDLGQRMGAQACLHMGSGAGKLRLEEEALG